VSCPSLLRRPAAADVVGDVPEGSAGPAQGTAAPLLQQLRRDDTLGQFARFVLVGAATTVAYAGLFVALQWLGYLTAHLIATAATTALANEMHRLLTFRAGERVHWFTAQWEAGGVTVLGLLATSTALGWLDAVSDDASVAAQITLVATVTAMIGLMRFVALRWIFRAPVADAA
jgi:putative flippase GtrA